MACLACSPPYAKVAALPMIKWTGLLLGRLCVQMTEVEQAWQSPKFLQLLFSELALHNEYRPGELGVRKWLKPVQVWWCMMPMSRKNIRRARAITCSISLKLTAIQYDRHV